MTLDPKIYRRAAEIMEQIAMDLMKENKWK